MSGLVAGTTAAISAVAFAGSTSLQHQAAADAPPTVRGSLTLVRYLLRQPIWLAGQMLAIVGLVLHGAALAIGSIAVVQPIVISGVVLAVPFRAAIGRRRPSARELAGVVVVAVGLTAFLVTANPSGGSGSPDQLAAVLFCVAGVLLAGAAMLTSRLSGDPSQSSFLLGAASGILFGVVAGLLKTAVQLGGQGPGAVLAGWTTWGLVLLGVAAVLTNQHAYRFARLTASMPVLNAVDGLVALGFGAVAFHERLNHSMPDVLVEVLASVVIAGGLVFVARIQDGELATPAAWLAGGRLDPAVGTGHRPPRPGSPG